MNICWNDEKNEWLKAERGFSFDQVKIEIEAGRFWGPTKNPAKDRENQKRILVKINGYPVIVPFVVMENGGWFLKTAYKNRKFKGVI